MPIDLKRAYAVFLRYFYIVRGNPQRLVQIFIWGILEIVVWGFLTLYLDRVGAATFSLVPVLLGGVVFWSFMIRIQQGVTTPALEDMWARNLLNYFASPLRISEYTLGHVFSSIAVGAAGIAILFALAFLLFGFSPLSFGVLLVPFIGILFLFGIAIGIIGVGIVLRYGPSAEWFIWPIPALLNPFVGVVYPVAVLPEWMQWIAHLLAPSYVFEGMRAALLDHSFDGSSFAIGFAIAILTLAGAYVLFMRIFKTVLRSGAFARYSAENVL